MDNQTPVRDVMQPTSNQLVNEERPTNGNQTKTKNTADVNIQEVSYVTVVTNIQSLSTDAKQL